ncbi:hypothetical protein V7200_22830, partial [Cytobacillus firmus]|uniref:hypothetical protein n=1 Tax=Cytobacillus firmus TaxID=1399 RepID=UPI002FFF00CF
LFNSGFNSSSGISNDKVLNSLSSPLLLNSAANLFTYQLGAPVAINHIGTCFNRFFKAINKYNFNISLSIFRVRLNDF